MVTALSLAIFSSGPMALIALIMTAWAAPESSARRGQVRARMKVKENRHRRSSAMIRLQEWMESVVRGTCTLIIIFEHGKAKQTLFQFSYSRDAVAKRDHQSSQSRRDETT